MTAHLEPGRRRCFAQGIFYVTFRKVGGGATYGAEHMMMMSLVAQLISKISIFKEHPANQVGFYQQAEAAVHGCPAHAGQGSAQFFGGKGPTLGRRRTDDQPARLRVPVTQIGQLGNDIVHHGCGTGPGMVVAFMTGV